MRPLKRAVLLLVLMSVVPGCGGEDPEPITPTGPITPATVTITFSGTVSRNGANTHPFTTDAGAVTATISTLSPDAAAIVGLTLGTWNGITCQTVIANDRATQASIVVGSASGSGNLCIRVYDATGELAEPTTYEVQVVHPQR
jgi:hypothetical protein